MSENDSFVELLNKHRIEVMDALVDDLLERLIEVESVTKADIVRTALKSIYTAGVHYGMGIHTPIKVEAMRRAVEEAIEEESAD